MAIQKKVSLSAPLKLNLYGGKIEATVTDFVLDSFHFSENGVNCNVVPSEIGEKMFTPQVQSPMVGGKTFVAYDSLPADSLNILLQARDILAEVLASRIQTS